jgi:hypothetical protein
MSLELSVDDRESKDVFYKQRNVPKEQRSQPNKTPDWQSWNHWNNEITDAMLDYNPMCKINAHECCKWMISQISKWEEGINLPHRQIPNNMLVIPCSWW